MKDTLTVLFFFIVLVFYEVYQALAGFLRGYLVHGLLKSGAKVVKIIDN